MDFPHPAPCSSARSERGLPKSSLGRCASAVQKSEQLSVFERVAGTQIHIVKNGHASVFPQRHDLSCLHVDKARTVLRKDHIMTCFLKSVHAESVLNTGPTLFTPPRFMVPKSTRHLTVALPSFLISFPPAHVHVSPRLDSGVSSTLKCGIP